MMLDYRIYQSSQQINQSVNIPMAMAHLTLIRLSKITRTVHRSNVRSYTVVMNDTKKDMSLVIYSQHCLNSMNFQYVFKTAMEF